MGTVKREPLPGLTILQYEVGTRSNLFDWRRTFKPYMWATYGKCAEFMDTYQVYRPTAPHKPTAAELKPDQDPNGLAREEYLIELKNYNQELRDCISKEPRMFADCIRHFSITLEERIKSHLDWATTEQDKNPGELMRITEEILTTGGSVDELDRKRIARKQWGKCFQIEHELLPHFRERFYAAVRALKAAKCPEGNMFKEELADEFLHRVYPGYYENPLLVLTQSRKQGQPGYPQTVEEAETLLTQWKYPSRQVKQVILSDTTFVTEMKPRRGNQEEEEKPMQKKFDGECYNCGKHGHMAKD